LAHKALNQSLKKEGDVLRSSFELLMSKQQENMLTIATFISNEPEVTFLFSEAKHAVETEGGGKGKEQSQNIRQQLYEKVSPAWSEVQKKFDARQLHFLLGPGANSFLRVHKPSKFGDNMDNVRHTIVDVNTNKKAVSGFETGRVYSGIRGVVPVFYSENANAPKEHIGALEVGSSFNSLLSILDEQLDIGAAVFLTKDHIESILWEESIQKRFNNSLTNCDCYLEASSKGNIEEIVNANGNKFKFIEGGIEQIKLNGENLAITSFPLKDYIGKKHPDRKSIGAVVFWKNIDEQIKSLEQSIVYNIIYGVIGFLLVEILIYIAISFAVRTLERKVEIQANRIVKSNWELNLSNNLIEKLREGVLVTDENQNITRVNHAVIEITGYSEEELLGKTPELFASGEHDAVFYEKIWANIKAKGFWEGDIWNRKKTGELFAESLSITAVLDDSGNTRNYVAVFTDITHKKKHQRYLEKAAFTDPLTKLPNRILLKDRLEQSLQSSKRNKQITFCIFIDLDKFKPINDNFGHDAGDFVLIELSKRMLGVIRGEDTLARIGGDEFVTIINSLSSKQECAKLVERLIEVINEPINFNYQALQVSASFGISFHDHTLVDLTAEKLLKQADEAMYIAKSSIDNNYIFYGD
jgi:diguanylate cyclase (GGDEF)-like protein/PAS domain S-box-containing protein